MLPQPAVPASTVTYTNTTGQAAYVTIVGGTVTSINVNAVQVATATNFMATVPNNQTIAVTYSAAPVWYWSNFTPAVPASGVAVANPTGQPISVVLAGGTVTHATISGPGITPTDRATSSPAVLALPDGDFLTLTYSAAPVWAWLNFLNLDINDVLGGVYADPNLVPPTGVAGYSELNALPYAVHATGGMAGFAVGVSN